LKSYELNYVISSEFINAVCKNQHFQRPMRDEFFREVGEAVRFGKQRNQNIMKRVDERERGRH